MPALLPWLALGALVVALRRRGLGAAAVGALVWWSALLALGSEVLSWGHALTRTGTSVYWGAVLAATGLLAWRARGATPEPPATGPATWADRAVALAAAVVVALVLVTTLLMPTNAQDVMTYHLPRVMHWAQGASLEPFPTHDSRQLYHPPFAELVDLHFLLLSGGDRWVGPLRVAFLAGAAVAAALVAGRLAPERPRLAQAGAAALALSAPTTLTLVHGGKNDPVAGFFLLALVLALLGACARPSWESALEAGLALGLALLTKTTAFLFGAPFVALLGAVLILRQRRRAWRTAVALAALPPLLLAGHMARNVSVYGHPLFDPTRKELLAVEEKGPAATGSNVLRFASVHFGGPSAAWNGALERAVRAVHGWLGLDADDPRTTATGERFTVPDALRLHSYAGSPAHVLLALVAVVLVVSRPRLRGSVRVSYALALVGAALLLCASLRWTGTVTRLHSPLLLLSAPLVAVALAGRGAPRSALYALLLAAAVPWILCSIERRLFGPHSALPLPRRQLLFRTVDQPLQGPAEEAAAWIGARGHRSVGVIPDDVRYAEYPLWRVLEDHVPGLRLEHVNATGPAAAPAERAPYRDFVPDVVVRVLARLPEKRTPVRLRLKVGEQPYSLSFQNERLALYERAGS